MPRSTGSSSNFRPHQPKPPPHQAKSRSIKPQPKFRPNRNPLRSPGTDAQSPIKPNQGESSPGKNYRPTATRSGHSSSTDAPIRYQAKSSQIKPHAKTRPSSNPPRRRSRYTADPFFRSHSAPDTLFDILILQSSPVSLSLDHPAPSLRRPPRRCRRGLCTPAQRRTSSRLGVTRRRP